MIIPLFVQRPISILNKSVSQGLAKFFNKFNLKDAYFFYSEQPLLASKFGYEWFDDPVNWNYFQASHYLLFYCISFSSELAQYQFFYKTQSFSNQELVHIPLNNLSKELIYAENAASTRTASNSEVHVFSIGGNVISKVYDGIPPDMYSNAIPANISNPLGNVNTIFTKNNSNGIPYYTPNTQNTYTVRSIQGTTATKFNQLLIYPLGFVEHVIINAESTINYLQNSVQIYINNTYKYFQIELPRLYNLTQADTSFTIQIEPKTTAVDIIFLTTKPIIGNECIVGQTLQNSLYSGFYRKVSPLEGKLNFVLPQVPQEFNDIPLPGVFNTNFNSNDAPIILFTGDRRIRGNGSTILPAYPYTKVFTLHKFTWNNWLNNPAALEPAQFQLFTNTSVSELCNTDDDDIEDHTLSIVRALAKTWDSNIVNGNAFNTPDLYLISISLDNAHCGDAGTNLWNTNSTHIKTLLLYAKILVAMNKKPRLFLWYHDEIQSRHNDFANSTTLNMVAQFNNYFAKLHEASDTGETSLTYFPFSFSTNATERDDINTKNETLHNQNALYEAISFVTMPGYNNTVPGFNVIDVATQYYLDPAVTFASDILYNSVLTNVGDYIHDVDGLVTPHKTDYLFDQDEVEMVIFVGDEFYNGLTSTTSSYAPSLSVMSWKWDDNALNWPFNSNSSLQAAIPFTDSYNWHNMAIKAKAAIDPNIVPDPTETIYCSSPIVEYAREWQTNVNNNKTDRQLFIVQFCFPLQTACLEFINFNHYAYLNPATSLTTWNSKSLLQRFCFLLQRIKLYFQNANKKIYLRTIWWSDFRSWVLHYTINHNQTDPDTIRATITTSVNPGQSYQLMQSSIQNALGTTSKLPFVAYINSDLSMNLGPIIPDYFVLQQYWTRTLVENGFTYLFNSTFFNPIRTLGPFFNIFSPIDGYRPLLNASSYFATTMVAYAINDTAASSQIQMLILGQQTASAAMLAFVSEEATIVQDNKMAYTHVDDRSKCYILERVDYTADSNFKNLTPVGAEEIGVNDVPLLIHLLCPAILTVDQNPNVEGPLVNVESLLRTQIAPALGVPTTLDFVPFTNNLSNHNIGNASSAYNRLYTASWEYAKLWEAAVNANPLLPKLKVIQFCHSLSYLNLTQTGSMGFTEQGVPSGSGSRWLNTSLLGILNFLQTTKTVKLVGFIVEMTRHPSFHNIEAPPIYSDWLIRFDEWARNLFNDNTYRLNMIALVKIGSSYIADAVQRSIYENNMRLRESSFASTRANIVLTDPKLFPEFTENVSDNGIYTNPGFPTKLSYKLPIIQRIARIWFDNRYYGIGYKTTANTFGNMGAVGAPYSRLANFYLYDMSDVNNQKNVPTVILTWNAHGHWRFYNKSQILGTLIQLLDSVYIEWNIDELDPNYPIFAPARSLTPILVGLAKNVAPYRNILPVPNPTVYETASTALTTASRAHGYLERTRRTLIAYLYNFSSLIHVNFNQLDNIPFQARSNLVDDINRLTFTLISTQSDSYSYQYLLENMPMQVIFKSYEQAFSKTMYYQLKHVDFIQFELQFNATDQTVVNGLPCVRIKPSANTSNFTIMNSQLPEFSFAAFYVYSRNKDAVQLQLFSTLHRTFRSQLLPSCIVNENGQTYCRYLPIVSLQNFEVYLAWNTTDFTVNTFMATTRIFMFLQ